MELSVENARKILKKYLGNNKEKMEHSERVAEISTLLAKKYNYPTEEAEIAALLHDIGKTLKRNEMLEYCSRYNITIYDFEIFDNESSLHGRISGDIFKREFKEEEENKKFNRIKKAIESHVAGAEKMELLDKIIFVADNVEPFKKDKDLLKLLIKGNLDIDSVIKQLINRKKERAKAKGIEYNPMYDFTIDYEK